MKMIFAAIALFLLSSCSGGGGGGSSETVDPIYGDWYYEMPGSTATQGKGVIGTIQKNGSISFSYYYAVGNTNNATFYTRKSVGTFERSGNNFSIKYSYETCDPVHQETLILTESGGALIVQNSDKSVTIKMSKVTSLNVKNLAIIEDKNCSIVTKLESDSKRLPASSKLKSFLERFDRLHK